jgi:uncharacterized damage-inducible protein DinB
LLVPVAHAFIQAREDAARVLGTLTTDQIWARPGGAASVGFHVRHLAGAMDRLLTYARGETLSEAQRRFIADETSTSGLDAAALLAELESTFDGAMAQLRATRDDRLLEARGVGRLRLPSTVLGLLFHAAEHATRHAGQAITTARIVTAAHLA